MYCNRVLVYIHMDVSVDRAPPHLDLREVGRS